MSDAHIGNVPYEHGHAPFRCFHRDFPDLIEVCDHAFRPYEQQGRSLFDISATGVLVIFFQGIKDVLDAEAHAFKPVRADGHFVLFEHSPEAAHIRHPFGTEELPPDDPVLYGPQFFQ